MSASEMTARYYLHTSFRVVQPFLNGWKGSLAVYPRCSSRSRMELVVQKAWWKSKTSLRLTSQTTIFRWGEPEKITSKGWALSAYHFCTWQLGIFFFAVRTRTFRDFPTRAEEF
jgi:hypothetical protein